MDVVEDDLSGLPAARLLRDFVNSREPQVDTDELEDPAALAAWFASRDLSAPAAPFRERHLGKAVDVREGLRALFLVHAGHADEADPEAMARLDEVLGDYPVLTRLSGERLALEPGSVDPLAGPMAALVDAVRQCREDGTWWRLKVCARDTCRWAFYDASRNKVRRWCSMAGCGNHVKMKRAYARRTGR